MKKIIFLIVIFLTNISVNSQSNTDFILDYWVKSKDNDFIFAIDKIENDSLQMNYYGHLFSGKIIHNPNYLSADVGKIGETERLVKVTFYTDERKGSGTIFNIGTNKDGSVSTPKPIELFNNKFKFAVNKWVAQNMRSKWKFTINKIRPDSLFVSLDSKLFSGNLGIAPNSIQVKLYEEGKTTSHLTLTIYTKEAPKNSGRMRSKGYCSIKKLYGKETFYVLESEKIKEQKEVATRKRIKQEKEQFEINELKRKRSLLTKIQVDKVQKDVLKLAVLTEELIGKYKEIKRYGRFASHSMIKSYKEVFLKWKNLYNNPNFERRPEHMTAEQYRGINNYADVLFAQHHNKTFNEILDSNY